jgi:RNA polymerase sigma factor (sigma-70 family)
MNSLVSANNNSGAACEAVPCDADDLEALYVKYRGHVYACAFKYCGGRADAAEDVVTNVFIKANDFLHQFDPTMDKKGWLYRITKHEAISQMKAESAWYRRTLTYLTSWPQTTRSPSVEMSERQLAELAWNTIAVMPARERLVATMHFVDDMSQTAIAKELSLSEPTISRSLAKIRQRLGVQGWQEC